MEQRAPLILVDTDIFVVDEIFTRGERHDVNARFLETLEFESRVTTVYNVLEFCGIVATALKRNAEKYFVDFHEKKGIKILYPKLEGDYLPFSEFIEKVLERIIRGMRYGDAKILTISEENYVDTIVTWNKNHYEGETDLDDISTVAALNAKEDPSYGFQLYQRFHYVVAGPWWDLVSWITFHIIYYNGVVLQTCPRTGVNYITDSTTLAAYVDFMWWYNANVGFGNWVWVGYD